MNGDDDMTPVRLIGFHEMDSALVDETAQGGAGEGSVTGGGEDKAEKSRGTNGEENYDDSASSLSDDQRSTCTTGYLEGGNGKSTFKCGT